MGPGSSRERERPSSLPLPRPKILFSLHIQRKGSRLIPPANKCKWENKKQKMRANIRTKSLSPGQGTDPHVWIDPRAATQSSTLQCRLPGCPRSQMDCEKERALTLATRMDQECYRKREALRGRRNNEGQGKTSASISPSQNPPPSACRPTPGPRCQQHSPETRLTEGEVV